MLKKGKDMQNKQHPTPKELDEAKKALLWWLIRIRIQAIRALKDSEDV